MKPVQIAVLFIAFLAGCAEQSGPEVARLAKNQGSISLPDPVTGHCKATDATPAIVETVTEDTIVQPTQLSADGRVLYPAVYETQTYQVILKERQELHFHAVCAAEMTPELIANLQRALTARGYQSGAVTGRMTPATKRALRDYQKTIGIESALLAHQTAKNFGLVAYAPVPES